MHFLWCWNISHDLFLIEMKFSPPQAKQNLTVFHPLSESCWDSQTSLRSDESTGFGEERFRNQPLLSGQQAMQPPLTPICWHVRVSRRCRLVAGKSFAALCSLSQSRLSLPAASRHAPAAPDCLIGTFQVRGSDKSGRSAQTVIHLFSSRRCSCPPFPPPLS